MWSLGKIFFDIIRNNEWKGMLESEKICKMIIERMVKREASSRITSEECQKEIEKI
jgi:ubiquitin-protein ligase